MRNLLASGGFAQTMGTLNGGAFLVAFALLLGANNIIIGLLFAATPLAQILQMPAVYLVDKLRRRRLLLVGSAVIGRLAWLLIAALPFFFEPRLRVPLLLVALAFYFATGAVTGCAFNSWMRDLIPDTILGRFFAKRASIAVAVGAVMGLVASFAVDSFIRHGGNAALAYAVLFCFGCVCGMIDLAFVLGVPEPPMASNGHGGFARRLARPFADPHFRQLLIFMGFWSFAINLVVPFFAVYMFKRLELSLAWVMGLSVISQVMYVLFMHIWGVLSDRFSNKNVLGLSGLMFLVTFVMWPFTSFDGPHVFTIPLLIWIHVVTGISTAGVNLCAGNIALKNAPRDEATAYLAGNSLIAGLAAMIGPLIGGLLGDFFANQKLTLSLDWVYIGPESTSYHVPAFSITGLDFVFLLAFVVGIYSLHRLLTVRERGEVDSQTMVSEFRAETRKVMRQLVEITGTRQVLSYPYLIIRDVMGGSSRRREALRQDDDVAYDDG